MHTNVIHTAHLYLPCSWKHKRYNQENIYFIATSIDKLWLTDVIIGPSSASDKYRMRIVESKADEFVHDSSNICGVINYRITSTRKIYQEKGYLIEEDEGLAWAEIEKTQKLWNRTYKHLRTR